MKNIKETKRLSVKSATEKQLRSWCSVLNDNPNASKGKIDRIHDELIDRGYKINKNGMIIRPDGVWKMVRLNNPQH